MLQMNVPGALRALPLVLGVAVGFEAHADDTVLRAGSAADSVVIQDSSGNPELGVGGGGGVFLPQGVPAGAGGEPALCYDPASSPAGRLVSCSASAGASVGASSGYAANTSGPVIAVVLSGTAVPLPDGQSLGTVSANGANTQFTIADSGRYRVSFEVKLTSDLLLTTRVTRNGTPVGVLVDFATASKRHFTAEAILPLVAGDVLELQLAGMLGAATLKSSVGASMVVERIE